MELHPTPESWRIALFTAVGAVLVAAGGAIAAAALGHPLGLVVGAIVVGAAAIATFLPAVGTLTAAVDADTRGVTVRRLGRASHYEWDEVVEVCLRERPANVPDGTEYHWIVPSRSRHVVAVPCLALANGRLRELPALAAPAVGPGRAAASRAAEELARLRNRTFSSRTEQVGRTA